MARPKSFLLPLVLVYMLVYSAAADFKDNTLNVPRILLPFVARNSVATNYTLKALNGCFHWTSTKPEIASVKPILDDKSSCSPVPGGESCNDRCSRSAVVTVTSSSSNKEATVILAEEESSGVLLRCDVFVDTVHRIEIATTTRELLLGESPEVFDVFGYDEEGNHFSSLGSSVLNWYLSPIPGNNTVDPKTVLRFLWFQESSYETEPEIYALEEKKLRGNSVIMEGINTGEALVSAKLVHSVYKDVSPSTVRLIVVDNIILQPSSDVYILVETTVYYRVKQLRRGHSKDIKMPSSQYQLKLSHPEYGILDHKTSSVTGKALGTTKVLLVDNNMIHTKSVRQPSATVHVVEPGSIGFTVSPGNVWVLETGRKYAITVEIYDLKKHKIFFSENTLLSSMFPETYLKMEFKSVNSSYHYVEAVKSGRTHINATLSGVKADDKLVKLKTPVFGEQQVQIFDPIQVEPSLVIFPWEPDVSVGKNYKVQLKALGGSGSYHWSTKNNLVSSVSNKGLVTSGNTIGSTKIRAGDVKNVLHYGEATVIVLPADRLNFLPSAVEAEIGKDLVLPLSVAAYVMINGRRELKLFEDCSRMPLKLSFTEDTIFRVVDSSLGRDRIPKGACKAILVKAVRTGFTLITASYHNGNTTLKASLTIAAYPPLVVVDPSEIATVALGSSKIVALEGGPQPWILDGTGYYESLSAEEEEWVGIQTVDRPDNAVFANRGNKLHFFKATCKQITGEQILNCQVGNKPTSKNQFPASSLASLRFFCTPPGSLSLRPDIVLPIIDGKQKTLESCRDADKRIPVRNDRELTVLLVVRDASGQIFDNATSLDIKWSSSDNDRAKILQEHSNVKRSSSNLTVSASQVVLLSARTGSVRIEAKISGYNKVALYAAGIYDDDLKATINPPIFGSLELVLAKERQIIPNHLVLFSHPMNMAKLTIKDGSRHFVIKSSDDGLASLSTKAKSDITITPKSSGRLLVSVYDMCLDSESPAKSELRLVDIHSIDVVVPDKVELHKTIKAVVQMRDHDGNLLNVRDMELMKLAPKLSSRIIEFEPKGKGSDPKSAFLDKAFYTLQGLAVGVTSLTYHAVQSNGRRISSKPKDIQVFPPLRLDPRHVILIAGATFQVRSHGGPQPQSTTVFEIGNMTVSSVNHVGLITALSPGLTTLTGMAQGTDPHSGKTIVYSKDQITVEVIILKGFKIHASATTLISGSEVGVYAVGYNGDGPFTFASSLPYLRFHWSLTNAEVASLKSVYHASGVSIKNEKDFRILLNTHKAGQTTIKLKVEVADSSIQQVLEHAVLEDEIQIQVFDGLKVIFPANGELLLPQNINSKIKTNRDGVARMTYDVIRSCAESDKASVVEVAADGHLKTSTASGSANILITSHEDFGLKQTAIVSVEVKAVASITLVPISLIPDGPDNTHFIPLSSSAKFAVNLHDNVGRKFDVSTIPLKHRLHRFDVVQVVPDVDNATYSLLATGIGNAVFKVWDEHNQNIADYIRINVNYGIEPSSASVLLGSMICFKSLVKTNKESSTATWTSSNPEILSMDGKTGVGIGNSVGSATISMSQGDMTTHVEVNVQKTSILRLSSSEVVSIVHNPTNLKQTFDIGVDIGEASTRNLDACENTAMHSNKRGLTIPFSCLLTADGDSDNLPVENILNVRLKYVDGRPYCEISSIELPNAIMRQVSTLQMTLSLRVMLSDHNSDVKMHSAPLSLPFIPSFILSLKEVELSADKPIASVKVTGIPSHLSGLRVDSEDAKLVQAELLDVSRGNSYLDYAIKREKASIESARNVTITFESAETGQKEKVNVLLPADPQQLDTFVFKPQHCPPVAEKTQPSGIFTKVFELFGESSSFFLLYSVLIATVVLIILVYHNFTQRDRNRMHQPGPQPYYLYQDHGSPEQAPRSPYNQNASIYQRNESPYMPGSGKRGHTGFGHSPTTTPGNRTLFSVQQ